MELSQLKTFVVVAEEADLAKAAERLTVGASLVSAELKALEQALGLVLFKSTPGGLALTPEGQELRGQAAKVLREAETFLLQARRLQAEISGVVTIRLNGDAELLRADAFLACMAASYPRLQCQLLPGLSDSIPQEIKAASIDGGYVFGNNPWPAELEWLVLESCELRIVGPSSWRREVEKAAWRELAELPWLWAPRQAPWRRILEGEFAARHLQPTAMALVDNEQALRRLLIAGAGLGVMPVAEAEAAEAAGLVAIWPGESLPVTLAFAYLKNRTAEPLIQATRAGISQVWGQRSQGTESAALAACSFTPVDLAGRCLASPAPCNRLGAVVK